MKVFNYSELNFSELTSFKIHTLEDLFLTVGQKNFGLTLNFDATLVKYWIPCLFFHHNFFVGKLISNFNHIICFTNFLLYLKSLSSKNFWAITSQLGKQISKCKEIWAEMKPKRGKIIEKKRPTRVDYYNFSELIDKFDFMMTY